MEYEYEEFDLRPFIELMLKQWKFIVGTAVGFAIVALIIAKLMPSSYQATALLAATDPQAKIQLDPNANIVASVNGGSIPTYISIATSDEALQQLLNSIDPPLDGVVTLADMRKLVEAETDKNSQIVELSVTYADPVRTAEVVNLWAAQSITDVHEFYSGQNDQQLTFLEEQLATTLVSQEETTAELVDFQSNNTVSVVTNELNALNTAQAKYLEQQNELARLMGSVTALRAQLDKQSGPLSSAEQLTILVLHTQVFDAQNDFTIQLQANTESESGEIGRAEQIAQLDALMATIDSQQAQIKEDLDALPPQILVLQEKKQSVEAELNGLMQKQNLLNEAVSVLSRKVEEERIASQNVDSGIRLVSKAAVPEEPENSSTLVSMILAAVIGGMFSVGYVFARDWWQAEE